MEDVCSVAVYQYTFLLGTINVARNVVSLVNNDTCLAMFTSFVNKSCPEKSCSYYKIIIFHESCAPLNS